MSEWVVVGLVALTFVAFCIILFVEVRRPVRSDPQILDVIRETMEAQKALAATMTKLAESLAAANDRTLAAANHLAYQTVKSFEDRPAPRPRPAATRVVP